MVNLDAKDTRAASITSSLLFFFFPKQPEGGLKSSNFSDMQLHTTNYTPTMIFNRTP